MTGVARAVLIRPLGTADLEACVALLAEMGGHDDVAEHHRMAADLIAHAAGRGGAVGLVAELDGRVVGYVGGQPRDNPADARSEMWLGHLAVASDQRGSGIGRALVDRLAGAARAAGLDAVALETGRWRDRTPGFYRSVGFEERAAARRFVRPLLAEGFVEVAAAAAVRAGQVLAAADGAGPCEPGHPLGKVLDREVEAACTDALAVLGLPVVSPGEGVSVPTTGTVVVVDPLDGSRNAVSGLGPTATAIGLVRDGAPVAGLVREHTTGRTWSTDDADAGPALRDGHVIGPRGGEVLLVPSPTPGGHLPRLPGGFARMRVSGCTTVDLCHVADGSAVAFDGRSRRVAHPQDLAATMAILQAAGAGITLIDEGPDGPTGPTDLPRAVVAWGHPDARRALLPR